jgi:hypothetical protein
LPFSTIAIARATHQGSMARHDERDLREELIRLRAEHRDLDAEIAALEVAALADQLRIQRLKKRKLSIKDKMQGLEDELRPDIIA